MGRIEAAIKRCERKGGDCPCGTGYCQAEDLLMKAKARLEDSLRSAQAAYKTGTAECDRNLAWLRHKPCTVRPDWHRPTKPAGDYELTVANEGDGWCLHWYSDTEEKDVIDIIGDESWPFVEETAWPEDWERLGVVVV